MKTIKKKKKIFAFYPSTRKPPAQAGRWNGYLGLSVRGIRLFLKEVPRLGGGSLHFSSKGFTFIELVIVFSITAILSTVGLAAFVDYSRKETLNTSVYDLVTFLNQAKSKAQSQVIQNKDGSNMCNNKSFSGYKISVCGLTGSNCLTNEENTYEFNIVCEGSIENSNNPIEVKKLPTNVIFNSSTTTTTSILFKSFVGGIEGSGKIVVEAYEMSKEVVIDSGGNITIQ